MSARLVLFSVALGCLASFASHAQDVGGGAGGSIIGAANPSAGVIPALAVDVSGTVDAIITGPTATTLPLNDNLFCNLQIYIIASNPATTYRYLLAQSVLSRATRLSNSFSCHIVMPYIARQIVLTGNSPTLVMTYSFVAMDPRPAVQEFKIPERATTGYDFGASIPLPANGITTRKIFALGF